MTLIERQVIVTWYTPREKKPAEDEFVVCTVSGRAKGNITFDHAILLLAYSKDEGWYSMDYDFEELTVHAWCDLDPYGGKRHEQRDS